MTPNFDGLNFFKKNFVLWEQAVCEIGFVKSSFEE